MTPKRRGDTLGGALVKTVKPIVGDLARPAAKEIGSTLGELVHWALSPAHVAVWTFEQATEFTKSKVTEILARRKIPAERIQPPAPEIASPAIQMLRLANQDSALRELYLHLIASAMDRDGGAHPAYVELIRQLSPLEARLIPHLHSQGLLAEHPIIRVDIVNRKARDTIVAANHLMLIPALGPDHEMVFADAIENLSRLGLVTVSYAVNVSTLDYRPLERHKYVLDLIRGLRLEYPRYTPTIDRGFVMTTEFGHGFAKSCLEVPPPS